MNLPGRILSDPAMTNAVAADLSPLLQNDLKTLGMLSSGFIFTSLLWAWALAMIIDRRLSKAAWIFFAASGLTPSDSFTLRYQEVGSLCLSVRRVGPASYLIQNIDGKC